jgi:alkyl hydroperoxide reductase subunit AhpC
MATEFQVPELQVSKPAPDFTLDGVQDGDFVQVHLSDLRGQWVVMFFYPLDFTFVCPTEIKGFAGMLPDLKALGATVLGVSVDSKYSHQAWQERDLGELGFPLLADITKSVSRDYGVLLEDQGIALRGTFIIDPDGVLRYMTVHELNVGRSTDETLRVLEALQSGGLCPINWKKGEATL